MEGCIFEEVEPLYIAQRRLRGLRLTRPELWRNGDSRTFIVRSNHAACETGCQRYNQELTGHFMFSGFHFLRLMMASCHRGRPDRGTLNGIPVPGHKVSAAMKSDIEYGDEIEANDST